MTKIGDYNTIMNDRKMFNQVVYTPLSEALRLLEERRKDPELVAKVEKLLKGDIPEVLKNKKCGVLHRNIATPNKESRRFISIAKENNLRPIFFEYHDDKFAPENEFKYSLGKITLHNGVGKHGGSKNKFLNIIDFNKSNGKKLKDVFTFLEEPLADFHRKLFNAHQYDTKDFDFYDGSNWYKNNGGKATNYYTNFFLLLICNGILFENFQISKDSEGDFSKNIVLPALEKVINLIGVKPLIVPLEPFDLETDNFWYNHDYKIKDLLIKKQK